MSLFRIFNLFILVILIHSTMASAAVIRDVDLFGTDLTVEQLIETDPELFSQLCEALEVENENKAEEIKFRLSEKIIERFSLAYVRPSTITYFVQGEKEIYITFDIVEAKDAGQRLSFLSPPKEIFQDPEGLLAAWDLYMSSAMELAQAGEIGNETVKSLSFHYIFGHSHPRLAPFEQIFIKGALIHKKRLIDIFLLDQREHYRASAVFILAYLPNGDELVELLSKRMRDPSAEVRNNIMRVFACIASDHAEINLPLEKILEALLFPNTTDRNKAVAIIYGLLSQEQFYKQHRQEVLASFPILLKMLKLKQPNNRDWAYQILKKLSNQDFPKEDIAAWENWFQKSA